MLIWTWITTNSAIWIPWIIAISHGIYAQCTIQTEKKRRRAAESTLAVIHENERNKARIHPHPHAKEHK